MVIEEKYPKVIAAAIKGEDGIVYHLPPPARHHDVGIDMVRNKGYPAPYPLDTQGFLLEDGTFAGRIYAKECAIANNQLIKAGIGNCLYSEDVW